MVRGWRGKILRSWCMSELVGQEISSHQAEGWGTTSLGAVEGLGGADEEAMDVEGEWWFLGVAAAGSCRLGTDWLVDERELDSSSRNSFPSCLKSSLCNGLSGCFLILGSLNGFES